MRRSLRTRSADPTAAAPSDPLESPTTWRTRLRWPRWGILVAVVAALAVAIPVAVTASSSSSPELYSWDSQKDIDFGSDVEWPRGVWGDGETMWVVDPTEDKIFAYSITAGDTFGDRQTDKDIDISAASDSARGIWSDGTYMYVSNEFDLDWNHDTANVAVFNLSDGAVNWLGGFYLHEYNNDPRGMWSDGDTVWVLQPDTTIRNDDDEIIFQAKSKMYAYDLYGARTLIDGSLYGTRRANKDINDLFTDGTIANGLWSDGTTIWTTSTNVRTDRHDNGIGKVHAFNLSSGSRDLDNEFNLLSNHSAPDGVWSDGTTLWIADVYDDKFYAYHMTGTRPGGL